MKRKNDKKPPCSANRTAVLDFSLRGKLQKRSDLPAYIVRYPPASVTPEADGFYFSFSLSSAIVSRAPMRIP